MASKTKIFLILLALTEAIVIIALLYWLDNHMSEGSFRLVMIAVMIAIVILIKYMAKPSFWKKRKTKRSGL
jgi:uncharacterized membrane protein YdjX (TVP38/TMEM64 family)